MKDYIIIYKSGKTLPLKAYYCKWNGTKWQFATNNGITLLSGEYIKDIKEN